MKKIIKPAVIGLGYVGLPIFQRLKSKFETIGFDINEVRIKELINCKDNNQEFTKKQLKINNESFFTNNYLHLKKCNFFIVTVPTPIYNNN